MAGKRSILIVEDDAALRETLAEQLADDHGFSVSTAAELGAANKIINEDGRPFDAVILDIGMPDGDGCQFCNRIAATGAPDSNYHTNWLRQRGGRDTGP